MNEQNVSKEKIQEAIKKLLDEVKEKSIMRDDYERQRNRLVKEIGGLLKKIDELMKELEEKK